MSDIGPSLFIEILQSSRDEEKPIVAWLSDRSSVVGRVTRVHNDSFALLRLVSVDPERFSLSAQRVALAHVVRIHYYNEGA